MKNAVNSIFDRGNRRLSGSFSALYKALAVAAVLCSVLPLLETITTRSLGLPKIFAVFFAVLFCSVGYLIMHFYAWVTKLEQKETDFSYEGHVKFFDPKSAALPLAFSVLPALPVYSVCQYYLRIRYETGIDRYFDANSAWPIFLTLLAFSLCALGVFLWFYPYYRIISARTFFWLLAPLGIGFAASFNDTGFLTVCAAFYLFFAFIVINQSELIQSVVLADSATRGKLSDRNTKGLAPDRLFGTVTPAMRLYNIALLLLTSAAIAVVLLICVTVVVGFTSLIRLLMFVILSAIFKDADEGFYEAEEAAEKAERFAFNPMIYNLGSETETKAYFWFFVLLCIGVMVFFILAARRGLFKKIGRFFASLYRMILNFITMLFNLRHRTGEKAAQPQNVGYQDIESEIDEDESRRRKPATASEDISYRGFLRRINSVKDLGERFCRAYAELAAAWRRAGYAKPGDSPRQIRRGVEEKTTVAGLSEITELYEKTRYGGIIPDENQAAAKTDEISGIMRKYAE
ncbi:MAG: hypothetical protein GX827_01760 [Clostridiales bacterium]|nr:hypothetical protein [Clostridiales bacterium]